MQAAILLAALASQPADARVDATSPPPTRTRLLLMDLAAEGSSPETARTIAALVAVQLAEDARLDVLAGDDLRRLADFEADKQAAGCTSDASCLAEIAGALDAEYVVFGQVGALGESVLVTLNLFDAKRGRAEGACRSRPTSSPLCRPSLRRG